MWRRRRGYVLGWGCGSKLGQRLRHGWGLYGWGFVNMNWGGRWRCWWKCWLRWRCKWEKDVNEEKDEDIDENAD